MGNRRLYNLLGECQSICPLSGYAAKMAFNGINNLDTFTIHVQSNLRTKAIQRKAKNCPFFTAGDL